MAPSLLKLVSLFLHGPPNFLSNPCALAEAAHAFQTSPWALHINCLIWHGPHQILLWPERSFRRFSQPGDVGAVGRRCLSKGNSLLWQPPPSTGAFEPFLLDQSPRFFTDCRTLPFPHLGKPIGTPKQKLFPFVGSIARIV